MKSKSIYKFLSVVFALFLWQIGSMIVGADYLLASPVKVIIRLFSLVRENGFIAIVWFSFLRISGGFLLSLIFGIIFAVIAFRKRIFEYFLWPFVITVKSVPIASFIILCLLWFNFNELTVFISFLISFPVIYSNFLQGLKNTDKNLKEVAKIYHIPFFRRLKYIYLPSVRPFLVSSCNVAIGMSWKAGVAAEVIGVVSGSIGGKLYDAKIYFNNADLLAWTVVIILISFLTEKLVVFLIKLFFERIKNDEHN